MAEPNFCPPPSLSRRGKQYAGPTVFLWQDIPVSCALNMTGNQKVRSYIAGHCLALKGKI